MPPTVWFDPRWIVDGCVAVFGPMGHHLAAGQDVVATTDGTDSHAATVMHATPMGERDIASIRLAEVRA